MIVGNGIEMPENTSAVWTRIPELVYWIPKHYVLSAWSGHTPFAAWLIGALRPRVLVELGTYYGMSYLAMCQAMKESEVDGRCFAVDSWEGDSHAGPMHSKAYEKLRAMHDPDYSAFSTLMPMRFEKAVHEFEDGSIDLLHIDGLHTYEAVKADFETWRPKMSARGVILFHDTQEHILDFGVHRLWAEIRDDYPSFEFEHEHGLGVLGVGSDLPPAVKAFFEAGRPADGAAEIRRTFSYLGNVVRARQDALEDGSRLKRLRANFAFRTMLKLRQLVAR
jgi:O-antigen biosynthesis protein